MRNDLFGIKDAKIPSDVIIRVGKVVDVYDEYDGLRIRAKVGQDNNMPENDIAYAFPLLPKTIQSVPKLGEAVFIIYARLGRKESNRYYIGPLISQPQFFNEELYNTQYSTPTSLLSGSLVRPLAPISHYNETKGAFPNINDIALIGRKSEDVILKEGEIDIRCGIRGQKLFDENEEKSGLRGDVVFNTHSPAYLQMKYKRGMRIGDNKFMDSVVNVVADKINLISHQDEHHFDLTDQENLIKESDFEDIMQKLHPLPYGDVLVDVLQKIKMAILTHVHSYPGLPPIQSGHISALNDTMMSPILSDHVRIS